MGTTYSFDFVTKNGKKVVVCTKTTVNETFEKVGNARHVTTKKTIEQASAVCSTNDEYDEGFGKRLSLAKVNGDLKIAKRLVDEKYPPTPKAGESLLDQFKKGILFVEINSQEEKDELVRLSGVAPWRKVYDFFAYFGVDKDNTVLVYGRASLDIKNKKKVTFAEFKASIEPPQPVGLVDKMGILGLMVKDANIIIRVESYEELRLAQIELRKKGVITRIEKKDMAQYKHRGFCFHVSNGRDFCCGLDWFLAKKECVIFRLENNEITKLHTLTAEPTMYSFSTAMEKVSEGKKVKRKDWLEGLYIANNDGYLKSPYLGVYITSAEDLMAKDWVIVD